MDKKERLEMLKNEMLGCIRSRYPLNVKSSVESVVDSYKELNEKDKDLED